MVPRSKWGGLSRADISALSLSVVSTAVFFCLFFVLLYVFRFAHGMFFHTFTYQYKVCIIYLLVYVYIYIYIYIYSVVDFTKGGCVVHIVQITLSGPQPHFWGPRTQITSS